MSRIVKDGLSVRCPTCGAGRFEKCELNTGQTRFESHRNRRLIAWGMETAKLPFPYLRRK
jgi:hypothetical protein